MSGGERKNKLRVFPPYPSSEGLGGRCRNPRRNEMKKVSNEELAKIVERHGKWLRGEEGGAWADLSGADLSRGGPDRGLADRGLADRVEALTVFPGSHLRRGLCRGL